MTPPADASAFDPFLSVPHASRNSSKEEKMYLESKVEDDVFRGDTKADDKARSAAISREVAEYSSQHSKPTPRSDRLSDPITPQNAQGVLPPEACVFVAKYVYPES